MSAKADSSAEEHQKAAEQLQDALKQKKALEQQATEHAATLGEAADKAGETEAQLSILREEILALQAAQDSGNAEREEHAAELSRLRSELEAAKADAEQSKLEVHAESQAALDKLKVEADDQAHQAQIAKAHADKLEKELEEALLREKANAEAREGRDGEVEGLRKERDAIKEELESLTSVRTVSLCSYYIRLDLIYRALAGHADSYRIVPAELILQMMDMNKAHFQQALEEAEAKHAKEIAEVQVKAEEKGEALDKAQKAVDEAESAKAAAESALEVCLGAS